jgi:hypothetical protein
MKLLQLHPVALRQQLAATGVWLRAGPFSFRLRSGLEGVAKELGDLYGQFEVRNPHETFADFHVAIDPLGRLRGWLRRKARFSFDGIAPFEPEPLDQAYPMLERGLDWCVSTHANQYLISEAAAVEKNGRALILAGPAGTGKSTLAAALALSGWRLLSDGLTLVDRKTGWIHPLARPIGLRNESIEIIRVFSAEVFLSQSIRIEGGQVAYLRPPKESVRRQHEPALPGWIVFPRWRRNADPLLLPRAQQQAFQGLSEASSNYRLLGREGFRVCSALIKQTAAYDFEYGHLEDAISLFERMADADSCQSAN